MSFLGLDERKDNVYYQFAQLHTRDLGPLTA